MSNRRTGKVARLPKDVRDVVNTMLRDGKTYAQIIAAVPHGGLNEQNLTNWMVGGHQDWLKEQERLEDMQAKREFALEIVRQNQGSHLHQASLQLAASQLYEALSDFDLGGLKGLLQENPENYTKVVNSLAKLSKGSLDREKFEFDAAKAAMAHADTIKAIVADSGIDGEEKLNRVRMALFGVTPK